MNLLGHRFFSQFWITQVLDIALVSFLVWLLLRAVWKKPAMRVAIAIAIVWVLSIGLNAIGFHSIGLIAGWLASVITFALIVIFSQEVKDLLGRFGAYLRRIGFLDFKDQQTEKEIKSTIKAVTAAVQYLHLKRFGGLIVLKRVEDIAEFCDVGYEMDDLKVTPELLEALLTPPGPFHDGAVVIDRDRITMARAILPLAIPGRVRRNLGTRHRAAAGLSEKGDAVVVVVSEESGAIRVAYDGKLTGPYTMETLEEKLVTLMKFSEELR